MKVRPFIKVGFLYGTVAGTLTLALFIATYYLGRHPLLISPFLDFRIFLFGVFLFFALKELRDYYNAGTLFFWQAFACGAILVMVASLVAATGVYFFGTLEKHFLETYINQMTIYLKNFDEFDIERIGREPYERNLMSLPATNNLQLASTYYIQGTILGFFLTIIFSVIMRKQKI